MSMVEDPFDDFEKQFAAEFDKQFEDVDVEGVVNFKELSDLEVLNRFSDVRAELLEMGEMMAQVTDKGRELQSQRAALLIVMRKRGIG